jgi:hypothetical protein
VAKGWIAGLLLTGAVTCPAAADEYWACDYEIDPGIKSHPIFQVTADEIIALNKKTRYRLLQNSPTVIVGARSSHSYDLVEKHDVEDGALVFIDKRTGTYRELLLILAKDFNGPFQFQGKCVKGTKR